MDRREFVKRATAAAAAGLAAGGLIGCGRKGGGTAGAPIPQGEGAGQKWASGATEQGRQAQRVGSNRYLATAPTDVHVAVASNKEPSELVSAAVEAYGGRDAIFRQGDTVVIKPNLAWSRTPEVGATVNPEILKAVIQMANDAGASEVLVVEHSCAESMIAFDMSGGGEACDQMGVPLVALDSEGMYEECEVRGKYITRSAVAEEILGADVYVNLPCLKHHGATEVTITLKNQMGSVYDRQAFHRNGKQAEPGVNLHQNIADLGNVLRPTINIVDATRVLKSNGPQGPGNVEQANTVIVSHDMVAADALGAQILGHSPRDIPHIKIAEQAGIGSADLESLQIARV